MYVYAYIASQEAEGGMVAVLVSSLMQEGFGGLYRGLGLQLLKTILAASILFLIKEKLQSQTAEVRPGEPACWRLRLSC